MNENNAENCIPKVHIRKAIANDFEQVYPLFLEFLNTDLPKEKWFKLFQNHWEVDNFSPGIVLVSCDQVVGFIGTIYSRQRIKEKDYNFCNLSSWVVKDDYRMYSMSMLFSLLRDKDLILTSFTSNAITHDIYNKLGFRNVDNSKRLIYPLPFFKANDYQLILDQDEIEANLSGQTLTIFLHHRNFGNTCFLIKHLSVICLIMGVIKEQDFAVYSVSDRAFFKKHVKDFRNKIFSTLNVKRIIVDEIFLDKESILFSRNVTWGVPYQVRTENSDVIKNIPLEYSELFLLSI